MKRIDKYIVKGLLLRFFLAHAVICGLYFIYDIMQRLDQLQSGELGETLPMMLTYYAHQVPAQILDIVPVLLLLSAGLLFVQLSKDGELLTLMASGVSLRRISLSIFAVALPVILLIIAGREMVVPYAHRQWELMEREMEQETRGPFLVSDREEGYRLYVGDYDFAEQTMTNVAAFWLHENEVPKEILESDSAVWGDDGSLLLEKVSLQEYDQEGKLKSDPRAFARRTLQTSLAPYDLVIAERERMSTRMPSSSLSGLADRMHAQPDNPYFKALFHSRLVEFVNPLVLLLIGLPILLGFEHNQQSRLVGGFICIAVAVAYHVLLFVAMNMGNTGLVAPAMAAWTMPVITSAVGGWLFATMRT